MSAGTRSSAITATAPASSAIFACSAVTTSMITPPLSMSAMPRLTRWVPVWWVSEVPTTDTGLPYLLSRDGDNGLRLHGRRTPECLNSQSAREVRHVSALLVHLAGRDRVVYFEKFRHRSAARQPEHAHQPAPPGGDRGDDRVVVELAGHEHLMSGRFQFGDDLVGPVLRYAVPAVQERPEIRPDEHGAQGAGQLTLGQFPPGLGGPGVVREVGEQQAGRRVEQARRGELERHRTSPHQRRVERGAGRFQPGVQPVEAAGPPRHVDPGHRDGDEDQYGSPRRHNAVTSLLAALPAGRT